MYKILPDGAAAANAANTAKMAMKGFPVNMIINVRIVDNLPGCKLMWRALGAVLTALTAAHVCSAAVIYVDSASTVFPPNCGSNATLGE